MTAMISTALLMYSRNKQIVSVGAGQEDPGSRLFNSIQRGKYSRKAGPFLVPFVSSVHAYACHFTFLLSQLGSWSYPCPLPGSLPFTLTTSSAMLNYNRSASLAITLLGAVSNFALTIQVLALWRSLKWEPESEWEASGDNWKVDGVKVIWGLVSGYFACAAAVCAVGLLGILKVILSPSSPILY